MKLYQNSTVLSAQPLGGYTLSEGPYEWIDKLIDHCNRSRLIIDQMSEAFPLHNHYKYIHNKIPRGKPLYIITSNLYEQKRYKRWFKAQSQFTTPINIIAQPVWAERVKTDHVPIPIKEYNNTRKHLFNCLNRQNRQHRLSIIIKLKKLGLIKNNLVSYPEHEELENSPLVVDRKDFDVNWANNFNRDIFLNTWFSVVNETFFNEDAMFHSEKIFKTILAAHPFVIVGKNNSLKSLHKLGFKTFNNFWSEDYDKEIDHEKRLQKIVETIDYICKLDWQTIWPDISKIIEYNQAFLLHNRFSDYD